MTDQRDKASIEPAVGVGEARTEVSAGISRRDMIRGASVALPTVLTLSSASAAAAAVSAMVVTPHNGPQSDGKFYCLDESTTGGFLDSPYPPGSQVIDPTRTPEVNRYLNRTYAFPKADGGCNGVNDNNVSLVEDPGDLCRGTKLPGTTTPNETYCYKTNGNSWNNTIHVPNGTLLSASAMASAGGVKSIYIRDV